MKQEIEELLNKLGFIPDEKQPLLYKKILTPITEGKTAFVDFRKPKDKEKGWRYAKSKDGFELDVDEIIELKQFKEERDKILQSSGSRVPAGSHPDASSGHAETTEHGGTHDTSKSSGDVVERQNNAVAGDVGQETILNPSVSSIHTPPDVKCVPAPDSPNSEIFEFIKRLTGNSILEVSGRSGIGKTKLLLALANMSIASKKKILFIDSEQNLDDTDISRLGSGYVFLPSLKEIADYVQKGSIPTGTDIVFLDSLGAEQNGMWGVWDDTKRNKCLSEMASVAYLLKMWAIKNKKIAIITNQPKSDRGKSEKDKKKEQKDGVFVPNESVGDKHAHIIKTALYMQNILMNEVPPTGGMAVTRSWVKVLKGRKIGRGKELFLIDISDKGTTLHAFDKENLYKYFLESTD